MSITSNLGQADILKQYQGVASKSVLNSIKQASAKTGVDFAYLLDQAKAESNFNPSAKAKTSSATGLYQFIDQTWLSMVKKHGAKHGLSSFADKIEIKNGKASVDNKADKDAILNLRNNPEIASSMAAELAKSNEAYLKHHVKGFESGSTELYFAHFLGANGAARFLNAMNQDGDQIASKVFKREAAANKNVFFDKATGKPRTLKQVYDFFDKKFQSPNIQNEPTVKQPETVMASNDITNQKEKALEEITHMMTASKSLGVATLASRSANQFSPLIDSQSLFFIQSIIQDMDSNTAFL